MSADAPHALVTVGTDVHPFRRVVEWADELVRSGAVATCFVQHGHAPAPSLCEGTPFLDWDGLQQQIQAADVVITHGGPATISEARTQGHLPVCVPRDPAAGEHVDDHQMRFASRLESAGLVVRCDDLDSLESVVRAHVADGASPRDVTDGTRAASPSGMTAFASVVQVAARRTRVLGRARGALRRLRGR